MAKILIVDDSAFTRNMIGLIVESGGHEVVGRAEDGEQAMTLFNDLHPELVTLDYLMPDMSGEAVLGEMIETDPRAKVIKRMAYGFRDDDYFFLKISCMSLYSYLVSYF